MEILKVSSKSNPNSVAGALANVFREKGNVEIQAVGAGALNQAIKAIAIARGFVAPSGKNLICIPAFTDIEIDGKEKKVTLDEIKKGNIVISKPGEKIAVDGVIIEGKAHLDESFITGESTPVIKQVGDKVIAGSFNFDGYLKYKAEKIGKESTVSQIVRLVIEASNTKAPIAKIADKIS